MQLIYYHHRTKAHKQMAKYNKQLSKIQFVSSKKHCFAWKTKHLIDTLSARLRGRSFLVAFIILY